MAKRTCKIDGCDRTHSARGWCGNHYNRWRYHGKPEDGPPPTRKERRDVVTGTQAADAIGVTYRQLDHWQREYDLVPDPNAHQGPGRQRLISRRDLPVLHVFADLVRLGYRTDMAAKLSHQQRLRVAAALRSALSAVAS